MPWRKVRSSSSSFRSSWSHDIRIYVIFLQFIGVIGNVKRSSILLIMRLNARSFSFYIIWKRLSGENCFLCWCIWGTVHILRGSVPALHLTWPWYIKFLESWGWIFHEKLANYRPWSRISRNKLVFFTNHGITFVHRSREINSFVHDSRQLIRKVHGSRKTPFLTFMVACESIRFACLFLSRIPQYLRAWNRPSQGVIGSCYPLVNPWVNPLMNLTLIPRLKARLVFWKQGIFRENSHLSTLLRNV